MIRVSVLVPTFRRPESFLRAARSVLAQQGVEGVELIAVDNSPEGSALAAFRILEGDASIPFRWAHEPRAGVAHARNAALALAQGDLAAWLDDDEEASPHWLASLIAVRRETGAQSVFGPVRARCACEDNADFYENLYSRSGPTESGYSERAYGIGNSLQPRLMFEEAQPFDPRANQTGGEDDALFASWADVGARFAWAADAWVIEHLGPERTHLKHGLKRAFAYGQGPCETAWATRDFAGLAKHMAIGAGQAIVFGAASAIALAGSTPRALALLDRAARGAGKVFWFWEQRFYGEALVRQPA
ncbi:glycosyltransferase family 2 protein [Terricaulis silvestris]|uniref:Putative glycosyl transferase n=1 Tax=Terricaulis silvestris TaxID=2686094 RepID=A0A6I6MJD8_9CAUL|nr:glycosyltransferase family A protein [Terricaulis silvestris]QGZ94779.1 putative glycosyl transferase [Terricaulis silvestris]